RMRRACRRPWGFVAQKQDEILRLSSQRARHKTWDVQVARIRHLESNDAALLQPKLQRLCLLWRTRNYRLRMLALVCEFSHRHGRATARLEHRSHQQRWKL